MHLKTAYFKIFNTRDINEKILYFYLCTFINNGRLHKLTHWKRLWCWEGLGAEGEGDNRGWDGWMASLTWWTWVWVDSRNRWWAGRPGVLRFMGSQRVGHDWATELNWTEVCHSFSPKEQVSFNFMAAGIIHSDFGAQENKICHCLHFPPYICHEVMGLDAMILVLGCWILSQLFHSLALIKRLFGSSSLSII